MNNSKIIYITSGKGPVECELAVALALKQLLAECHVAGIQARELNRTAGQMERTLSSVMLELEGSRVNELVKSWEGVVQWICTSPYRSMHKRKNWFIAIHAGELPGVVEFNGKDVQYKTMRAGGPGGQHVNKTESAVQAMHIPSGIFVRATESRSQHENKKRALQRLKEKIQQWQWQQNVEQVNAAWLTHHQLQRGNPKRVYAGIKFEQKN